MAEDVTLEAVDGLWTAVTPGTRRPPGAVPLPGLVLPGLANAHSHTFHRALRGRTHGARGSFWDWRELMYAVAERLDPDRYLALARAVYAEMALAGVTTVGEFHYLHHGPAGRPYADPNAMGYALVEAASAAGIRLTLLDACYLTGGLGPEGHLPLGPAQRRFADRSVEAWAERVAAFAPGAHVVAGAAAHSVRAVPAPAIEVVGAAARAGLGVGAPPGPLPLHVHASEQPAENESCLAHYGLTPVQLLESKGFLGPATTAVHATHLAEADGVLLARSGTGVCFCPTTERDLGDGIGPGRRLLDLGVPLCLGSDQNATVDLLAEAQALEMDERLGRRQRAVFCPAELVAALTVEGHRRLGWPESGELRAGARADLVAVRLDTGRTAGSAPDQAVMTAGAADVDTVVVGGRTVVSGGQHVLGDVGLLLAEAIKPLWDEP